MNKIEVAQFGGPEVLQYVAGPDPSPGPGQVVVRVHAAGVNPADTYIRSGTYAFSRPEVPYTPGFDCGGVVHSVGSDVDSLSPGDRVFVAALGSAHSGAYAELMVCPAHTVRALPDQVTFEQGAAIGVPCITAYRALFQRGGARHGETVLIHGASGGVGLPAVQMAAAEGLTVIGTAGTAAGRRLVLDNGAHHVLDHSAPDYLNAVTDLTHGRGADLVIEMLADANLEADLKIIAMYGCVVIVGSRGTIEFTPRLTMVAEADIRGMAVWNMPQAAAGEAMSAVSDYLARGVLKPVVGHVFPLREAAVAHEKILTAHAAGKMILDCT